jgi:hypothetical protein
MNRSIGLVLVVPLLLVLAACAPTRHVALPSKPHSSVSASDAASASASPTATAKPIIKTPAVPPKINATDYLINGTPNVPDSNGEWFGEWAFFTDSTKRVWCELSVFSGDGPGANCYIVPTAKSQASYAIPANIKNNCDSQDSIDTDGYGLGLGLDLQGDPSNPESGWAGCSTDYFMPPADLAKSKVLPDGGTLAVAPFTCSVASGVATCVFNDTYDGKTGTVTLGMKVATFSQT